MPFLVTDGHEPTASGSSPPRTGQRFDDTTKCILCAACTTPARCSGATASTSARPRSSTPTASSSTRATRAREQRLEILNDREGVWRCRTIFNCTDACPRGIKVTKAIQEVKRALVTRRF